MRAKEAIEAKELLKVFRKGLDSLSESKLIGALDVAIEALGKDTNVPSTDTISRQDVIELVKNSYYNLAESMEDTWAMVADVERLPSAQPGQHTCVNCGRTVNNGGWYADGGTRCPIEEHYALPKDGYCHLWEKRNVTDDNYPERREE